MTDGDGEKFLEIPEDKTFITYWHPTDSCKNSIESLKYAWYEREVVIPKKTGRAEKLQFHLNVFLLILHFIAMVKKQGKVGYFGGIIDITDLVKAGKKK